MKSFLALASLLGICNGILMEGESNALIQSVIRAKWSSYKANHKKSYSSPAEEAKRLRNYLEATRLIEEHNSRYHAGLVSFEMGHNAFSDMTHEEIASTMLGSRVPENVEELMANVTVHVSNNRYNIPQSIDWRIWGGVQEVKQQGSCGSCYAFGTIGALETAHWRKHNVLPNLSEQHVIDCSREYGNGGCKGGFALRVYSWFKDNQGVTSQAEYPYTASVGTCRHKDVSKVAFLSDYVSIKNEKDLLNAVATIGTVAVSYNANSVEHSYYKSGILDIPNCSRMTNHLVLIVGYGSENGKDFWIIKNSWGSHWGENGYFRMVRGSNMCGISDHAMYPVV